MSDHFILDDKGRCHTIITMANIYEYDGFIFEFRNLCGPCKLNKNWVPSARQGIKFFRMIDKWNQLNKEQKEKTRIAR